ncbi:MAG TPA: periplasmic heavy metal sensor [Ignavibacteriaceae bacterium]|jgi:Spy/CpxP family protein refolding chaperone|nr:periplasmic heavy metal sensor [Ignavibacteriaceae bacterium]
MDLLTKQKTLIWIIVILIALNLTTLALLWFGKPGMPLIPNPPGPPPNMENFLKQEMKLTEEQEESFKEIRSEHQAAIHDFNQKINEKRGELRNESFKSEPDTALIEKTVNEIGELNTEFERYMFEHFLSLRKILTEEQIDKFSQLLEDGMKERFFSPPPKGEIPPPDSKPIPPPKH